MHLLMFTSNAATKRGTCFHKYNKTHVKSCWFTVCSTW